MISEEQEREDEILKELDLAREALESVYRKLFHLVHLSYPSIHDIAYFALDKAINAKEALERLNRKDYDNDY